MKLIIDRIENEAAVCETEDGGFERVPLSLLPEGAREGDVILEEEGIFRPLPGETEARRRRMTGKLTALFGKRG